MSPLHLASDPKAPLDLKRALQRPLKIIPCCVTQPCPTVLSRHSLPILPSLLHKMVTKHQLYSKEHLVPDHPITASSPSLHCHHGLKMTPPGGSTFGICLKGQGCGRMFWELCTRDFKKKFIFLFVCFFNPLESSCKHKINFINMCFLHSQ